MHASSLAATACALGIAVTEQEAFTTVLDPAFADVGTAVVAETASEGDLTSTSCMGVAFPRAGIGLAGVDAAAKKEGEGLGFVCLGGCLRSSKPGHLLAFVGVFLLCDWVLLVVSGMLLCVCWVFVYVCCGLSCVLLGSLLYACCGLAIVCCCSTSVCWAPPCVAGILPASGELLFAFFGVGFVFA